MKKLLAVLALSLAACASKPSDLKSLKMLCFDNYDRNEGTEEVKMVLNYLGWPEKDLTVRWKSPGGQEKEAWVWRNRGLDGKYFPDLYVAVIFSKMPTGWVFARCSEWPAYVPQ